MNNTTKQSKKYLIAFATTTIAILAAIALTVYIVDPFFLYRTKDKSYLINPIYNNVGLAKNYDFNTAIIGSSMIQNYDLSILRKDSIRNTKPVKLASGAISIADMTLLYSLTDREKTSTYIFNLDMVQFAEWMAVERYPAYLQQKTFTDKLQYLFAYESVVRYTPIDIILQPYLATKSVDELPSKLKLRYSIDDIGNFSLIAKYNDANNIIDMYHSGQTVSTPYLHQINYRMKTSINSFLETLSLDKNAEKEYIFILPPYSALYWHIAQRDGYFEHLMNNIKYICRETQKYKNVRIQAFFNLKQITNLDKYSDVTHFDPPTSNYILENLRNEQYTINPRNMNDWIRELENTVDKFRENNKDWI